MPENHNIEDFFKKRLETHEWPFQEEDWLLIEKRLDAINPYPSGTALHLTKRTIIIIVAALTAAFILGWLTSEYFQNSRTENTLPVSTDQNNIPLVNVVKGPIKNDIHQKSDIIQQKAKITVASPVTSRKSLNRNTASEPLITEEISEQLITAEEVSKNDRSQPLKALTIEIRNVVPDKDILYSVLQPPTSESTATHRRGTAATITSIPFRSRWAVGIILAPDYNGVRLLQGRTVSTAIGGIVAYQFTPRWSASFRFLYNNKKYSSEADYYKLPEEYWIKRTNGIIPDKILGSCRVIDIPVMATYHFIRRKSMSFTASAGIGSYFMLDEKYHFEFSHNNPGADTQWQTKENSRVFFGTINLALGAEFQTTRRINFVIEPYLKLPLKEIGWGNVNLYGMGLSLTMKYRL